MSIQKGVYDLMLKIKNKIGKTVMILQDDANEPISMECDVEVDEDTGEVKLKKAKTDKEKADEAEE